MPAFTHHSQPAVPGETALDWFDGKAGRSVLASEDAAVGRVLAMCPALPWLWIGAPAAVPPSAPRGVRLHRGSGGFSGDLRCRLPFPIASECFGAIFIQHALDDGDDAQAVLDECARVLAPGGRLWLATLNPWSAYRLRWAGSGLRARGPGSWQSALRRAGFSSAATRVQWLGPHWKPSAADSGVGFSDRFRCAMALSAGKQVHAIIPPQAVRQLRWQVGRWPVPMDAASPGARPKGRCRG